MGILDTVLEQEAKKRENLPVYKAGWQDGYDEGFEKGRQAGFAQAKAKYKEPDFYDPVED